MVTRRRRIGRNNDCSGIFRGAGRTSGQCQMLNDDVELYFRTTNANEEGLLNSIIRA